MPPLYVQVALFARDDMPGYLLLGGILFILLWMMFDPFGLIAHVMTHARVAHFADVSGLADLRYAVGRLLSGIPGGYTRNARRERQLNDKSYMTLIARNHMPNSPSSGTSLAFCVGDGTTPPGTAAVRGSLRRDIGEERAIKQRASPDYNKGGGSSPGGAASSSSPVGSRASPAHRASPQGTSSPSVHSPSSRPSSPVRAPSPQALMAAAMPVASPGRWLPRGAAGEPGRESRGAISQRAGTPPLLHDSPPPLYSWRGYETPSALTDERRHML